ncbi:MAG: site-2 protease family protein [Mesorhizobium sp.]|uniref:site-2 protease family protein n=2 Tax=Mesorhizobium TaxID=68287 RepID=UPI000F74CCAB|nr:MULTISPECIES: site-2 protease family protein [unclassified Mesorhizobium]AZO46545.1 site-2 protease family protein [Mesorhizobium sp. M4B.F.Ca.ET.058.02.1.1]RVC45885.1 site-2 protease family protein [Mesorhizobium sp. M4A.F.Ca.ET.090.04.2.1]RVD43426.1 site-2 protease family protein [Mesorhizobium sp. M4A.F.Ca.ET.020.02.1.1]RWC14466.1 MAG: site-2 protease family protein [Mesorhizobium sp.]RWC38235.1 MAG: site-2 protease family protein [Mesorhizobium sp.]
MSPIVMAILLAGNLGLIFLLMTVPLGLRTVTVSRLVAADRHRLWQALWPFGSDAGWSGEIVSTQALDGEGMARITLSWEGRDGQPIERRVALENVVEASRFSMRVLDDSSLDASFWANYRETIELAAEGGATRVSLSQTDRYRGVAFLIFRYFAMRRELGKLQRWARTGEYRKGGWFEHPLSQVGFAVLSAFILWPFFGLSLGGLALAAILTSVVALHELGHMAAFRLMGHSRARMIFIPLLGGIAIGGRPYDSRFEVAFVALMGAGFSAFLVPVLIAASGLARGEGHGAVAALLATLAGFSALFNIANLVPVWKFDGGQVLRQICPGPIALALASFLLLSALLALGWLAGFSPGFLLAAGVVFLILSLLTMGSAVKPRHELKPIRTLDRFAMAGALLAVFAIHGYGVLWASAQLV